MSMTYRVECRRSADSRLGPAKTYLKTEFKTLEAAQKRADELNRSVKSQNLVYRAVEVDERE